MDFLKNIKEQLDDNGIQVVKQLRITYQCEHCTFWGKMDGGIMSGEGRKAVFLCPECSGLNFMEWTLD